jgi:hypothetical protein
VELVVAGSNPVGHPTSIFLQWGFNQTEQNLACRLTHGNKKNEPEPKEK